MNYEQLLLTIIAIIIGSLIASYLDFLLLEDLRQQKHLQYEMMMTYGNF
jgi:uncharacterized membrane-anchored protein YhcB (DUF1043 family)